MNCLALLFGIVLLIVGGNALIASSVLLAKRWKVSPLLVGIVVLGFGTSLPELSTSMVATLRNVPGIAIGNVLGANIANILLVLGIAAVLRPIKISPVAFQRDSIFLLLSTIVLVAALLRTEIDGAMGALMCMTLAFYIYYSYKTDKAHVAKSVETANEALSERTHIDTKLLLAMIASGFVIILFGAHVVVKYAILVATDLKVLEIVIGLTIVALGTSLPELATAIVGSKKGHGDMVIGNVIGSNIYNALFILGATAMIMPGYVSVPPTAKTDVLVMVFATLTLLGIGFGLGRIGRKTGIAMIVCYVIYILYLGIRP
ncbi:MAG: calcium/sodium antiporter [Alphaproteobacteria bacterium]|nr:calcium/sodium antiporter [Alphaproteobacteria bacterium]